MAPATATSPAAPLARRRFLFGLAVAALLAVGAASALLSAARSGEARGRADRGAVIALEALADMVARSVPPAAAPEPAADAADAADAAESPGMGGGMSIEQELAAAAAPAAGPAEDGGAALRERVSRFAAAHPELSAVRVVDLVDRRLVASTDPADEPVERQAPRRLRAEEKDLYDLGRRLRSAVDANAAAGPRGARDPEISVERRPREAGGGIALAAPVVRGGQVEGLVQIDTVPAAVAGGVDWGAFLLAWLAPVLAFALVAIPLGGRRKSLAVAAAVLLAAALAGYELYALRVMDREHRATASAIAARLGEEATRARALLPAPIAPPLEPARWDVDLYRQPRGLVKPAGSGVGAPGEIDRGELAKTADAVRRRWTPLMLVLGAIALLLLQFVGWGGAAKLWHNLVHYHVAYAYTLPAMIGMVLLVFFPFFYAIALSFTNANIYNTNKSIPEIWIGLQNFKDILGDFSVAHQTAGGLVFDYTNFYWTLFFTVVWTVVNVVFGVSMGLVLALILNTKGLAFRPIYRVILVLPWAMPNYITALIWRGMFHPQFGVINQVIQMVGGQPVFWFSKLWTSFVTVLATNGWLSFPFMMVVSLGALQSIPSDLYEAAKVDGASRWQQFTSITLPSLKPALVPAVILSVIWTFNMFNIIYLVSAGEPQGSTEILATKAYKLAFEQYRYGYAAAYSTVIFFILLIYGTWQNRVTRGTEGVA